MESGILQREARGERRGFTLIEAIVVVVILGVAAAAIAPRLARRGDRATMAALAAARGLLESVAQRRVLSTQSVGLLLEDGSLTMVTRLPDSRGRLAWRNDPLVDTVGLNDLTIERARLNGIVLPPSEWLAELPAGEPTRIELLVRHQATSRAWWMELDGGAGIVSVRRDGQAVEPVRIDLDELGMRDEPW